jgi:superfamily II DNA or RNA helicase
MKLVKRKEIEKPNEVYNLHIKNDHNYIVDDAIVANCHTTKADKLQELLTGPFANIPIRWGFTGTIPKDEIDSLCLLFCIGPIVNTLKAHELQDQGVLANLHIDIIQTKDHVSYKEYADEYRFLVTDETRVRWLANFIEEVSNTGNTLVLIDRIETGEKLVEYITKDTIFIQGATKNKKRREHFEEVNNSNNEILIATFGTCSTGINIPRIFNLVMVEAGKSFIKVIQSIGRSIRMSSDKDFANIFDITASTKYSKKHLSERKKFYDEAKYPYTVTKVEYR